MDITDGHQRKILGIARIGNLGKVKVDPYVSEESERDGRLVDEGSR